MLPGPTEPSLGTCGYIRLFFAYTVGDVPRTGELETRRGSLQGLRREYPGARGDDAVAAGYCQVSALP